MQIQRRSITKTLCWYFVNDKTPNGIYDLVGNVAEWMEDQDEGQYSIHPGSWHNDMMSAG